MSKTRFPRVASLKTSEKFQERIQELGLSLNAESEILAGGESPLSRSIDSKCGRIGNRFAILPMEGWDGTENGAPTDLTIRRWKSFGASGAKLIWGGEAVAVRPDGRANPNQLMIDNDSPDDLRLLHETLRQAHVEAVGNDDDLVVGLQLTHSGRFARPNQKSKLESLVAYEHPVLDRRSAAKDAFAVISDEDIRDLVKRFVRAAVVSEKAGFQFVDVKHCHGYFGHELLSGYDRDGDYGGSFENRTRFLREIVDGIRSNTDLQIGVRISIFDFSPYCPGEDRIGVAESQDGYRFAFGGTPEGKIDYDEPMKLMELFQELGIELVCTTAGSPYYNPHIQRPAAFPPSDGYLPPEDPLVGVDRQIAATAILKTAFPDLIFVGSGYTYLQDWLPNVAQHVVREGKVDLVGLGRMVLSYPELPVDVLRDGEMKRKKICRTFSDCTTAPRNGMVSGCYPLDDFYKARPERKQLVELKKELS